MVFLHDLMDLVALDDHIEAGNVSVRQHRELPLAILNYTAKAQYEWNWDGVTRQCRGLIYNIETLEVISRPFEKFHNWDESNSPYPPSGPCLRMEKMDGSLGILYRAEGLGPRVDFWDIYRIATRGSMHSEQAEWATKFMREARITHPELWRERQPKDEHGNPHPDFDSYNGIPPWIKGPATDFYAKRNKTYLFEIIYPENRIVVDYGDYKGLVLIDVIDNETGFSDTDEFDNCNWPDKVKRIPLPGFMVEHVNEISDGDEGFVYLWPTRNFRTKMKSAQYVELHRLISHLNEKTVWEAMVAGKSLDEIKIGLPEEFHKFVDDTNAEIMENVINIMGEVNRNVLKLLNHFKVGNLSDISRKELALAIKDNPYKKYIFLHLDNRYVYPVALQDSKPKNTTDLTREE